MPYMKHKDLRQFTYGELSHFKYSELQLPNPPLLSKLSNNDPSKLIENQYEYLKQLVTSINKQNNIFNKELENSIKQTDILKEQLEFAKSEAVSAKKEALFAKVTSIIAILISIAAIIVPIVTG